MDMHRHSQVEELLTAARGDTPASLGRLFQYYSNYLKLLVAAQLSEKLQPRCSPSDIVQETFCEAHRDFAKFRGRTEAEFLAWLKAILINNLAREVERHVLAAKRDVRREVRLDAMNVAKERSAARLESALVDRGPSPSSDADRHERAVLLANYMAALSPDYRQVLVLRHCESLPFKEIAGRMGRSEGAIRMLWLRAISQIRDKLNAGESP